MAKRWTDADVLDALRAYGEAHGQPSARAWQKAHCVPSLPLIQRRFGSWGAAVKAAGFAPPPPGHRIHPRRRSLRTREAYTCTSWRWMRNRCDDPTAKDFRYYGGRGITICSRWQFFDNFFTDMGRRPPGLTLDRIDPNGNYEPGNCRWATMKQQRANRRG